MANKKPKDLGPDFTGGAQLVGFEKIACDVTMQTELTNGKGAYILSYADNGDPDNKSGLSFGGNQMDMSKRPIATGLSSEQLHK